MSQAIHKNIKQLKDFAKNLGWFKSWFFSSELRAALNKVSDTADKFTQKQAFDVYSAYINKTGGLFNWLGKQFLSGLKTFAEFSFTQNVMKLKKLDEKSFEGLLTAQSKPAAETQAKSVDPAPKVVAAPNAQSETPLNTSSTDLSAPSANSVDTNAKTPIKTPIDVDGAPTEGYTSTTTAHEAPEEFPSFTQAEVHASPLAPKTPADDIITGHIELDTKTTMKNDSKAVRNGTDLYVTVRHSWKNSTEHTNEDTKFHKQINTLYLQNPAHTPARALTLLKMVKKYSESQQQPTQYVINLVKDLNLSNVTLKNITDKLSNGTPLEPENNREGSVSAAPTPNSSPVKGSGMPVA